jgi:hypothetical protein
MAEAKSLLRELVPVRRRVLGEEHPDTVYSTDYLSVALNRTPSGSQCPDGAFIAASQLRPMPDGGEGWKRKLEGQRIVS